MSKDFSLFREQFVKYQRLFGLTGYKAYFKHEPIDSAFASISINYTDMVATVRLNSILPSRDKPHKDIKGAAKHEALHLLTARLEGDARYRYSTESMICESAEELVHKLEELID